MGIGGKPEEERDDQDGKHFSEGISPIGKAFKEEESGRQKDEA